MGNSFGKTYRLLKTEDFSSVFALRKQRSRVFLQVLESPNNELGHARLGLVVSKKAAKRANKRNLMKRVIREWFRLHQHQLPPQDFVVRVRVAFLREHTTQVHAELKELLFNSIHYPSNHSNHSNLKLNNKNLDFKNLKDLKDLKNLNRVISQNNQNYPN